MDESVGNLWQGTSRDERRTGGRDKTGNLGEKAEVDTRNPEVTKRHRARTSGNQEVEGTEDEEEGELEDFRE